MNSDLLKRIKDFKEAPDSKVIFALLDDLAAALRSNSNQVPSGGNGWVPVPREPTREMLNAARDWSLKKYGQAVGDDGAIGCYTAMLQAASAKVASGDEEPKARFFVDHGVLHDRKTGMHWRERDGYSATEDCEALNAMDACPGGVSERYLRRVYMDEAEFSEQLLKAAAPAAPVQESGEKDFGTWLWTKLMDYCKEGGMAPASQGRLFKLVKEAREFQRANPAVAQSGDGWRPIESAPKDGTVILGRDAVDVSVIRHKDADSWYCLADGYRVYDMASDYAEYVTVTPTHWMPLPSPPSSSKQGGAA